MKKTKVLHQATKYFCAFPVYVMMSSNISDTVCYFAVYFKTEVDCQLGKIQEKQRVLLIDMSSQNKYPYTEGNLRRKL